jgi:Spy/CpxP family protein refolding chaperone
MMMSPARRSVLVVTAAGVAVFVAGLATGIMADRWMSRRLTFRARVMAPEVSGVLRQLDKLGLTPLQRTQAESILSRRAPASEALLIDVTRHLGALADSVDAELRQILTPAQRARFDSLHVGKPRFMLKRQTITPRGTMTDTLFRR